MDITHVIWGLGVGGAENMLVDIISKQIKTANINLIIIDNVYSPKIIKRLSKKTNVLHLERQPGHRSFYCLVKLNWILIKLNSDIVHCHEPSLRNLIYVKNLLKSKIVLTCHDTGIKYDGYDNYDVIYSISKAVKDDLYYRYQKSSILVLNGVNFNFIIKKQYPITSETFNLIQISRLEHNKKGQEVSLRALHYIVYELGIKNINLTFIGSGPSKRFLIDLSNELQLQNFCNFIGVVDRDSIYSTLHEFDLLIQPSFYEGFGLTIVEGMGACLPVLVSNIEGPQDIVKNGKYGYVFDSGNFISLSEEIIKVYSERHSKKFNSFIKTNYSFAKKNYNIESTARSYIQEYKNVCDL